MHLSPVARYNNASHHMLRSLRFHIESSHPKIPFLQTAGKRIMISRLAGSKKAQALSWDVKPLSCLPI